jgi:hypothetical protein
MLYQFTLGQYTDSLAKIAGLAVDTFSVLEHPSDEAQFA